jgi:nitroimidazol reductase NimA-like FMN-containing flavoprotein (pyridoxamine 5'-phosphate oxidase superfamily)
LACSRDDQPYIVPIYFVYEPGHLYGFTTPGLKVDWMRVNPRVCVQADEVFNPDNWTSVVILGRYEELSETAEHSEERNKVQSLLVRRTPWFSTVHAASVARGHAEPPLPVFYRIHITEMTGLRASPDGSPVRER